MATVNNWNYLILKSQQTKKWQEFWKGTCLIYWILRGWMLRKIQVTLLLCSWVVSLTHVNHWYHRSPSCTSDEDQSENSLPSVGESNSACAEEKEEEEWVFIRDNFDLRVYKKDLYRLCKSQNCNGVALFLFLLLSILTGHDIKDEEFAETLSYVGSILRNMDIQFINVQVLRSLQALVECVNNETILQSIYENLLFDFRIWSSSDFNVRIGHIQFISTQIKDNPVRFRSEYGVRFFLDIISQYYGEDASMSNSAGRKHDNQVQLPQEEIKIIRASLLGWYKHH